MTAIENSNALAPPDSAGQIKAVINAFLQERLQPKLEALKLEEEEAQRQQLRVNYLPAQWIPDAARRVAHIQQVTHALKFSHPDARGSSLSSAGNAQATDAEIGSHTLGDSLSQDVVGNAAALDVFKFLRLTVDGRTLLERAVDNDVELATAFSDDAELAQAWMSSFAALPQAKGPPSSHKLAKQIYWPTADGEYHLLAPLFPTSLVHGLWTQIRQDRFSEEAKAARTAKKEGLAHPHGYCEYLNLAIQNFGGTKPQNISQLNSERHGENFLLPSLPPTWKSPEIRPPLGMSSVFDRLFGSRPRVRELNRILRDFLVSVENAKSTEGIRNKRAKLASLICDEVFQYAAEVRQLEPGWSKQAECQLNPAEQGWLDPERAVFDADFADQRRRGDWPDEIGRRFGNWLNARLTTANTPMDAVSAAHWQDVLSQEMRMMRLEIAEDD